MAACIYCPWEGPTCFNQKQKISFAMTPFRAGFSVNGGGRSGRGRERETLCPLPSCVCVCVWTEKHLKIHWMASRQRPAGCQANIWVTFSFSLRFPSSWSRGWVEPTAFWGDSCGNSKFLPRLGQQAGSGASKPLLALLFSFRAKCLS